MNRRSFLSRALAALAAPFVARRLPKAEPLAPRAPWRIYEDHEVSLRARRALLEEFPGTYDSAPFFISDDPYVGLLRLHEGTRYRSVRDRYPELFPGQPS